MTTSDYDWTQFTRQVFIKADVRDVFNAWVVPSRIIDWFIAQAHYLSSDGKERPDDVTVQTGDKYHWRWRQEMDIRGEILNIIPNELLQFTFGENSESERIIVTVKFREAGDETLIDLTQQNMTDTPADHTRWHLSCNLGWSFFLTNLKALMEHGVDLREKSPERSRAARAVTH